MKIITQSKIVANQPYFHLGYIAATYTAPRASLMGPGVVLLAAGAILLQRFSVYKGKASKKKASMILAAGLISTLVGAILTISGFVMGRQTLYDGPKTTRLYMQMIRSEISRNIQKRPADDTDLTAWWAGLEISPNRRLDPWKNELKVELVKDGEVSNYIIVSAGEDQNFGTEDDIRSDPLVFNQQ